MKSTEAGYINKENQINLGRTDEKGTDFNQRLYRMRCLDCGFEYKANGTDIWLRKCPKCRQYTMKREKREKNDAIYSGNAIIPESYLLAYEAYMRKMTGNAACKIIHNQFVDSEGQEGYKLGIASKTHVLTEKVFGVNREKRPKTAVIIKYAMDILRLRNNLVNGHTVKKAEGKLRDEHNQEAAAEAIWEVMCGDLPETAYDKAAKALGGYNFALLAYLFFVRNSQEYLPVSPENFDRIFGRIGREFIDCPRLSGNGTWKTYSAFLKCMSDIKMQLVQRYPDENVTLLDAHSMLWIMGERDFINYYEENKDTVSGEVREKESITCAKARIGQGEYRRKMLEYWSGKCAVTGCGFTDILVASHAKPWKECDSNECRDPFNGLLLIPNLDALFDRFLISFEDDGHIIISDRIESMEYEQLGISGNMKLRKVDKRHLPYLKYHREEFNKHQN